MNACTAGMMLRAFGFYITGDFRLLAKNGRIGG